MCPTRWYRRSGGSALKSCHLLCHPTTDYAVGTSHLSLISQLSVGTKGWVLRAWGLPGGRTKVCCELMEGFFRLVRAAICWALKFNSHEWDKHFYVPLSRMKKCQLKEIKWFDLHYPALGGIWTIMSMWVCTVTTLYFLFRRIKRCKTWELMISIHPHPQQHLAQDADYFSIREWELLTDVTWVLLFEWPLMSCPINSTLPTTTVPSNTVQLEVKMVAIDTV